MFDNEVTRLTHKSRSKTKPRLEISVTLTDGDENQAPNPNILDEYEDEDKNDSRKLSSPFSWPKSRQNSDTSDVYSSSGYCQVCVNINPQVKLEMRM